MNNLTVIFDEMLEPGTIERIGLDHDDPAVCVTRLCAALRALEEENAALRDGLTLIANGAGSAPAIAKLTLREASET